jgi:co-chaperonin GroES (HSP10)
MTTTAMLHDSDPREDLMRKIGNLDHVDVMLNQVLVATYIRPKRTRGGIILTAQTQDEDRYQGKVGLVIAKGPQAFVDDDRQKFDGQNVQIGDWICYRMSDGWQFNVKGMPTPESPNGEHHCRMLLDIDIKAKISHPDDVI